MDGYLLFRTRDEATYAGLSQRGPPLPGEAKVSGFVEDYDAYKVGKGGRLSKLPVKHCENGSICSSGHRLWLGATCLKGHVLAGEERWAVQWQKNDDSVWYEIYAFSKPDSLLAWIAYPVCRYYQMKFRRDSAKKMLEALQSGSSNE